MFKSKLLTEEQIEYIKNVYGYKRTTSIAKELSVTPRYVQKVATKLGVVDLRNKYYIENGIAYILCVSLDNDHIYFQVDEEDLEAVLNYSKWFIKDNKNKKYVVCNKRMNGKRTVVRLHRFLLNFPEKDIDHVDGNPLNNCRNNLRICEDSQNMSNLQTCRSDNKSTGSLNVVYDKKKRSYRPEITINHKRCYFKHFKTLEEAQELVKYVRANYLPYSQEALQRELINEETSENIKSYVIEKLGEVK